MDNVLPFWIENYFTHPSYLKIDGKPVLYIWVPRERDPAPRRQREGAQDASTRCGPKCQRTGPRRAVHRRLRRRRRTGEALEAHGRGGLGRQLRLRQRLAPARPRSRRVGDFICAPVEGFVDQQEAHLEVQDATRRSCPTSPRP